MAYLIKDEWPLAILQSMCGQRATGHMLTVGTDTNQVFEDQSVGDTAKHIETDNIKVDSLK